MSPSTFKYAAFFCFFLIASLNCIMGHSSRGLKSDEYRSEIDVARKPPIQQLNEDSLNSANKDSYNEYKSANNMNIASQNAENDIDALDLSILDKKLSSRERRSTRQIDRGKSFDPSEDKEISFEGSDKETDNQAKTIDSGDKNNGDANSGKYSNNIARNNKANNQINDNLPDNLERTSKRTSINKATNNLVSTRINSKINDDNSIENSGYMTVSSISDGDNASARNQDTSPANKKYKDSARKINDDTNKMNDSNNSIDKSNKDDINKRATSSIVNDQRKSTEDKFSYANGVNLDIVENGDVIKRLLNDKYNIVEYRKFSEWHAIIYRDKDAKSKYCRVISMPIDTFYDSNIANNDSSADRRNGSDTDSISSINEIDSANQYTSTYRNNIILYGIYNRKYNANRMHFGLLSTDNYISSSSKQSLTIDNQVFPLQRQNEYNLYTITHFTDVDFLNEIIINNRARLITARIIINDNQNDSQAKLIVVNYRSKGLKEAIRYIRKKC